MFLLQLKMKLDQKRQFSQDVSQESLHNHDQLRVQGLVKASKYVLNRKYLQIGNYFENNCRNNPSYHLCALQMNRYFNFDLESSQQFRKQNQGEIIIGKNYSYLQQKSFYKNSLDLQSGKGWFKSFTSHRRKIDSVVFVLVDRIEKKFQCGKEEIKRGLFFFSIQGQILNTYVNLDLGRPEESAKLLIFVRKHFQRLTHFIIIDNSSQNIQSASNLINELSEPQRKIIYISPEGREFGQLAQKPESEALQNKMHQRGLMKVQNIYLQNKNILSFDKIQTPVISHITRQALWIQSIHMFIVNFLLRPSVSAEQFYGNKFCVSAHALYFNSIAFLIRKKMISDDLLEDSETKKAINNQIASQFDKVIQKSNLCDENLIKKVSNHYGPSKYQICKKCLVCKKKKTKYGCERCSNHFGQQIHLCIDPCFKQFHKNPALYIPTEKIQKRILNYQKDHHHQELEQEKACPQETEKTSLGHQYVQADHQNCQQHKMQQQLQSVCYKGRFEKLKIIRKKAKDLAVKHNLERSFSRGIKFYKLLTQEQLNLINFKILPANEADRFDPGQDSWNKPWWTYQEPSTGSVAN